MNALHGKENIYTTSQVAGIIGIHPNTVRLYEDLELISKPFRKSNGYRTFTDLHVEQFKLARTAFEIEALQGGLRKIIVNAVKLSAKGQYGKAISLAEEYIVIVEMETRNANEAIDITQALLRGTSTVSPVILKRKDVSKMLNISMDTLRNWEMNGLLHVRRKENGYRVYNEQDIQKLKIIRSLRCANYSLSAILRMLNALSHNKNANVELLLNTPHEQEDVVSVCDRLIVSLNAAKTNAQKIREMLIEMKRKY